VRVAVLGDSFVFGYGIDEPHLFPARLAEIFGRRRAAPYEVANLAVTGYSTDQELLLYRSLREELRADIVILVVCDNDFEANTLNVMYRIYAKPFFTIGPGGLQLHNVPVPKLSVTQRGVLWLRRNSRLWNALRARSPWFEVVHARSSGEDPVGITTALIRALAADVGQDGGQLLVVNTGRRGEDLRFYRALRRRLSARGIRCAGLWGPLKRARDAAPEAAWDWHPEDSHWNVASHMLVAREVFPTLESAGILDKAEAKRALQ